MKATCAMPDTRSSRPWPEETVPLAAEHRGIVSSGSPFWMAALRMAGPMPARQHGPRAQMRFAGSVQHVSAEKPCQRVVTQAKAGGSLPHIDNMLNQSSDAESSEAGLLREVTFQAPTCFAILAPSGRYPFSKRTIASDRSRFRRHSRGKQPARRCPARSDRLRSGGQDQPPRRSHTSGGKKRRLRAARPSSVPGIRAFARYCASLCQNSAQSSSGAT